MAITVFKDSTYQLSTLIDEIRRGEIALPDIQRPFVWKAAKVRDLFDSMYRGFPVGYLLFWATGAEAGARQIGIERKEAAPRLMIVDGQQRLTSLFSVFSGTPVVREDFTHGRIRIAFRPRDARFEVTSAATENDPEFLPDVSALWLPDGRKKTVREYLERLRAARGDMTREDEDQLEESIDRLFDLRNYPFKVLELTSDIDEEQVADVFVRINSEGVRLEQADFILTLMSVWWEEGRRQLEEFCRSARSPSTVGSSPANPFIDPSPDQLLRVGAGLAFKRGRLRYVYAVLRGKDLQSGEVSLERREQQFGALREAQTEVLDLTNWHEFLKAVRRAGYRSRAMITSENNLLFAYLMYLIGRRDFGIPRPELREVVARWFFMAALTGRYTGNFEGQVERDLERLGSEKDPAAFIAAIDSLIDTELTNDFWTISLPNALDTSAAYSPTLFTYHASLVLLGARPLFSKLTIAELMDPSAHAPRSALERHHLFPRNYLSKIGVERTVQRNQIANFAFVEWPDNARIGDRSPAEYFPELFSSLSATEQKEASFWHALPQAWHTMEYGEFLGARRILIANVVKAAFEKLRSGSLPEELVPPDRAILVRRRLRDVLAEGEKATVEFKSSAFFSYQPDVPERVVTEMVLKTVAGFGNAEGGTLAIGVSDEGEVLGIRADLDHKNLDVDRYVNALTTLLERSYGGNVAAQIAIEIESTGEQDVCLVHVPPAKQPLYVSSSRGPNAFYVRTNNSTRLLEGPDLVSYVVHRWPS